MAVMPDLRDEDALRPYFKRMRELFERLQTEAVAGARIEELSMGMSGDYEIAAQEGATHVRIGSAIFGARTYQENNLKGETPVSYTHLDVYKRQASTRRPRWIQASWCLKSSNSQA